MPKHAVNSEKKEASNKKRLAALEQKKELARKSKLCIDPSGTASAAQHIVFSSSGDSDNEASGLSSPAVTSTPHLGEHTDEGAIRRALFRSDSEDSATEEDPFASRRQFEGKAGEKLFKLQQKIGVDKRFRLDDRFLDSSGSESDDASEQISSDDLMAQLQQEKSQALSIIDSILGSSRPRISTPAERDRSLLPRRYDPTSSTCAMLEQPVTSKVLPDLPEGGEEEEEEEEEVADTVPEVSKERFFSVSSDLKTLFSRKTEDQAFSFLGRGGDSEAEEQDSGSESEEKQAEVDIRLRPKWLRSSVDPTSKPYHREDHSGDDPAEDKTSSRVLFFFHSTDRQLCNRLEENSFHRQQPLRELEARWAERRAGLKQAYKRRHKEAAKLARKRRKY